MKAHFNLILKGGDTMTKTITEQQENMKDAPSADGTYVLKATVLSSGVTYSWVEE